MKKGLLAIALMAAMASLVVCGDGEVREIVVTATPETPSETASPGEVATEAKATVVPESRIGFGSHTAADPSGDTAADPSAESIRGYACTHTDAGRGE